MRVLLIHAHPDPQSYNAALKKAAITALSPRHEVREIDLYAEDFQPVLTRQEWRDYEAGPPDSGTVADHVALLNWAEALVFVYPTWWYGLPAIMKGWLDRIWLPGVAFSMPSEGDIRPSLTHVRKLAVITTCGASWWLTQIVGAPGRNTLIRGCGFLMAKGCRKVFLAHYSMDDSTPKSRVRYLDRVTRAMEAF
jgi:putative NADPH-quinone reductase